MTGNSKPNIVLQERDQRLLEEISTMRVIDREQAKVVAGFGSTTRANKRLLELTRLGLLKRSFISGNQAVYMPAGASRKNGDNQQTPKDEAASLFAQHHLKINEIYLLLRYRDLPYGTRLGRWLTFTELLSKTVPLIPDGYFDLETPAGMRASFLEVDLGTEALPVWQRKVQLYMQMALSGEFARIFQPGQFRVLVITTSERRLSNIRQTISKTTDKIFWFASFETINRESFWSPIWLRPKGDQRQSLV